MEIAAEAWPGKGHHQGGEGHDNDNQGEIITLPSFSNGEFVAVNHRNEIITDVDTI